MQSPGSQRIRKLTIILVREGDLAPAAKFHFYGNTDEDCDEELRELCQHDALLRKLVEHGAWNGYSINAERKDTTLAKAQKGM